MLKYFILVMYGKLLNLVVLFHKLLNFKLEFIYMRKQTVGPQAFLELFK